MRDVRKRAFATGYLAGLSGIPVATALGYGNDPLYLYGGVALPPLPVEWDREEYPYAVITKDNKTHVYKLLAYRTVNYYVWSVFGLSSNYFGFVQSGNAQVFTAQQGSASWSLSEETSGSVLVDKEEIVNTIAIWTHGFDLMYSDGSLYVAASTPGRITDWEALRWKYFYNDVVLPYMQDEDGWGGYDILIMKHETDDVYIMFRGIWWSFYCDTSSGEVFLKPDTIAAGDVFICPAGGDEWKLVDTFSYLGERKHIEEYSWYVYCIGKRENIVWAENGVGDLYGDGLVFEASEQVPIPEPPEVSTDNTAVVLGCRLGYIVRSQMKNQSVADGHEVSESASAYT